MPVVQHFMGLYKQEEHKIAQKSSMLLDSFGYDNSIQVQKARFRIPSAPHQS